MTESGIYQIRALHSGEVYVGSTTNFEQRKKDHFRFLRYGTHDNPKLQASYNKYGADNFVFEILLVCEPENCLDEEQRHFELLNPHFNLVRVAGMPPSRKGKKCVFTEGHLHNIKTSAIVRGKKQRQKTYEDSMPLFEEIKNSGLSVRKFCALKGLTPNRTSINSGYRRYINET